MAPDFTKPPRPEDPPEGPGGYGGPQDYFPPTGWPVPSGAYPPAVRHGYPPAPAGYGAPTSGPVGQIRGTGVGILLTVVTLGIYPLYWFYVVHEEMKRHTGNGLGGGLALLIAFFVRPASAFITSYEVGELYTRRGWLPPVTGLTGLWFFPGAVIVIGPLVWWVKTNGALNAYWRSVGAY